MRHLAFLATLALLPTQLASAQHPASQLWANYCASGNCGQGGHLPGPRSCSSCNDASAASRTNTACDQAPMRNDNCASGKCGCGQNCNQNCGLDLLNLFGFALCSDTHRATACSGGRSGTCGNNACYAHAVPSNGKSYAPAMTIPPVHVDPPAPQPEVDATLTPAVISPPKNVVPKKVTVPQEIERSIFVSPALARPAMRLSDFIKT
jgi:hypothetical protein